MPVTGEKIALMPRAVRLALRDAALASSISRFSMPFCVAALQRSSSRGSSRSSVATISLPTLRYSMPLASQYSHSELAAFGAELGLERARLVVDARVDDAAVVARSGGRQTVFLFEDRDLQVRVARSSSRPVARPTMPPPTIAMS